MEVLLLPEAAQEFEDAVIYFEQLGESGLKPMSLSRLRWTGMSTLRLGMDFR